MKALCTSETLDLRLNKGCATGCSSLCLLRHIIPLHCFLLSWTSGRGATHCLSYVINMGISYSRYHDDGMINSTQSITEVYQILCWCMEKCRMSEIHQIPMKLVYICNYHMTDFINLIGICSEVYQ